MKRYGANAAFVYAEKPPKPQPEIVPLEPEVIQVVEEVPLEAAKETPVESVVIEEIKVETEPPKETWKSKRERKRTYGLKELPTEPETPENVTE